MPLVRTGPYSEGQIKKIYSSGLYLASHLGRLPNSPLYISFMDSLGKFLCMRAIAGVGDIFVENLRSFGLKATARVLVLPIHPPWFSTYYPIAHHPIKMKKRWNKESGARASML